MFDDINSEMISNLTPANLARFDYIKKTIERGEITSPLVVRRFSDLAFALAQESMRTDAEIEIAKPLLRAFNQYLNSSLISIDAKQKMNALIGETKLDLLYASGNHDISSLRLAPYLIAQR